MISLLRNDYKIKSRLVAVRVSPQNTDTTNDSNDLCFEEHQKAINLINNNKVLGIKKRGYGCEARHPDYYVIGTKGELYICEHLVGQQQYIMGNIKNLSGRLDRTGTIWDTNSIIDDCKDCPIVPICLGFCTSQRYIVSADYFLKLRK